MNGTDCRRRWLGLWVLMLAWTVCLAIATPVCGQFSSEGKIVAEVRITGNRAVPETVIRNYLKTRPGRRFSIVEANQDAARLMKNLTAIRTASLRTYPTADDRLIVEFVITEHTSRVEDVQIRHARHLDKTKLELLNRIRKGAPLNPLLNKQAAREIEEYYRSKGYFFATVRLIEGGKPGDRRVIFEVSEGPLVKIRSITFTGNKSLASQSRLRTQINSKQSWFRLRFLGSPYNPAMVEHDVRKLEEYYRENGYLDVKISRELKFSEDFSMVDIVFHIDEGVYYRIADVTVEGAKTLPPEQLQSYLKTRRNQVYNGTDLKVDVERISQAYGWRGYKAAVRPELVYVEPGLVKVKYQVSEPAPKPARVGQIRIIGNEVTKDRVIRRVLGIYPGQILRYPELRIAEANLARLNIFEVNPALGIRPTVTVIEDPLHPDAETKDILVQVQETYTGSFMVGLGVNSNAGLVGSIVLNERNFDIFRPPLSLEDIFSGRAFRGGGQEFRLEAVPGTQLQRYTVSFREPFLFDRPFSLSVSAYYFDRIYREYIERRIGGRISLGHQFNRQWSIVGGMRIENVNVRDVPSFAPVDYTSVVGDNFVFAPRVALVYDGRDSFLRPTQGGFVETSAEYALGDFDYPILNLEASRYFTTYQRKDGSGKHVVALRGQVSWAGDNVPVYDRFFAGGYQSLRGFEFRGVGPFIGDFNVGGRFMMLSSIEYQVPITASDKIYLVAFLDGGTVERDVRISDYRLTAGFGARITVPMMGPVPIALDFGFPIVRGPGDREQVFSFYFGLTR